jgi:hypothetical protein
MESDNDGGKGVMFLRAGKQPHVQCHHKLLLVAQDSNIMVLLWQGSMRAIGKER